MAEDLRSANIYPHIHVFSASDSTTTEIQLPNDANRVTVGSSNKDLFICQNGATDGGAVPSNKAFVPSSNYLQLRIGRGKNRAESIFVSSQSGSANVTLILEEI